MSTVLPTLGTALSLILSIGCGNTVPEGPEEKEGRGGGSGGAPGHAPELVGFSVEFVEETGLNTLLASARLGDLDDDLVPDGSVSAVLIDDVGRERMLLDAVVLGAEPSRLPEPTLLEVEFSIADDPTIAWTVRMFVTDRGGLSSEVVSAEWVPEVDTGS